MPAGPLVGEGVHLVDDQVAGGAFVVRWVVVVGQQPADVAAELGAYRLTGVPVPGDLRQGADTHELRGRTVLRYGVVEVQLGG